VTIHPDLLDYVSSHITLEVMYAGMNSWCPDEPLTGVSQTSQEAEKKEDTHSSYIYKILKQSYSDTGISNKARRRETYSSYIYKVLKQIDTGISNKARRRRERRHILFLHLQDPQAD
jgi:hypothetical protein